MKILLSAVIPLLFLAGCGSSGANVSLSQTSANLKQAIDSYNQTKPAGLAAQGSACKTAAAALPSHTFRVSDAPPNLASQVRALRHAYQSARKGFQLCSSAAVQLNYPRMVAANSAIRNADHWVHTAKRL